MFLFWRCLSILLAQRRKAALFELLFVIGLPFLIMALCKLFRRLPLANFILISETDIIIQPARFEILEEFGCDPAIYSYVGYIIYYGPVLLPSLGCAILAREFSHVPW